MAHGPCETCRDYSYELEEYNDKYICEKCFNKLGIDYKWQKDYNEALEMLNGELIL